jgi:hypothetical protein
VRGGRSASHHPIRLARQLSRRQCVGAVASSLLGWSRVLASAHRKLEPRDEAWRDPDLQRLLRSLATIVEKRQERQLLSLIGERFRVEFGAGKGRRAFRRFWRTDQPNSEVWNILDRLLAIGGTFYSPTLFAIPYVYTQFPIDLDPFGHVTTLNDNVVVYRESRPDSRVVAVLDFDIVPTEPVLVAPVRPDRAEWIRVIVTGQSGYVNSRQVWSPAAHRMFFEKRSGRWEWISLVCAD